MWGPGVELWRDMRRLEDYIPFSQLYNTKRNSFSLSDREHLDLFMLDEESARDLNLVVAQRERYGREETPTDSFFGIDGYSGFMFTNPRISNLAQIMFQRAILLPERSSDGVRARQNVFRALQDTHLAGELFRELRSCDVPRYSGHENIHESFLDYMNGTFLDSRSDENYDDGLSRKFLQLRNAIGLAQRFASTPGLEGLTDELSRIFNPSLHDLNRFLLAEKYNITIDGDFLSSELDVQGHPSQREFTPVKMSDNLQHFGRSPIAKNLSVALAQAFLDLYRGNDGPFANRLNWHLAMFEACLQYSISTVMRGKEWCLPDIVDSPEPFIEIEGMVHPMYLEKGVVIGDVDISGDHLVNVLTGSNDGGKTQFIRGLGQIVTLAHAGFPIPARNARMSLINNIFTNFSGKDDSSKGRYKTALSRWMYVLNNVGQSLVLADEPTDGTFTATGVKHGLEALTVLGERKVPTATTTHYHEMAEAVAAGAVPNGSNLHAVTNTNPDGSLVHTYKIEPGADPHSYGEEVAIEVGFTSETLERLARGERTMGETARQGHKDSNNLSDFDDEDIPF